MASRSITVFYADKEGKSLGLGAPAESADADEEPAPRAAAPAPAAPSADALIVEELQEQVLLLTEEQERLSNRVAELATELERIARQAGIELIKQRLSIGVRL